MSRRYPFADLAAAMGLSESAACRQLKVSGSTSQDYRRNGLSERVADRLAVKAGLHPFEVWPEMAEDSLVATSVPCAECGEPLLPTRAGHRFHRECYARRYAREWKRRKYAEDAAWQAAEKERARAYRESAARAVAAKRAAYKRDNAELLRERKKAWYQANRDVILAKQRERDRAKREGSVAA